MKRFEAKYSENSITYWPYYESGKVGIIYLTLIGTLFVGAAIWTLLDNPSRKNTYSNADISSDGAPFAMCCVLLYL